jgi:hypothetical protein
VLQNMTRWIIFRSRPMCIKSNPRALFIVQFQLFDAALSSFLQRKCQEFLFLCWCVTMVVLETRQSACRPFWWDEALHLMNEISKPFFFLNLYSAILSFIWHNEYVMLFFLFYLFRFWMPLTLLSSDDLNGLVADC